MRTPDLRLADGMMSTETPEMFSAAVRIRPSVNNPALVVDVDEDVDIDLA